MYAGFIQQFEITSRILDTDPEEKGFCLLTCLKGKAAQAMETFDIAGEPTYDEVKAALDSLFRQNKDTDFWLSHLKKCRLGAHDSVHTYRREVSHLVGHAYRAAGAEMREKMLKHHFEQGIPREFLSALIAAKCQSNADRVHIIEQLQRLESDLEEPSDAPAKKATESACFTKSAWKPSSAPKPEPAPAPQEETWKLKVEE